MEELTPNPCKDRQHSSHSTLKVPFIKKVKINTTKDATGSIFRRRCRLADTEENAKPPFNVSFLKTYSNKGKDVRKSKNPFLIDTDAEIFQKREADAISRQQEKVLFRRLPVQLKGTFQSHLRCRSAPMRSLLKVTVPENEREKSRRDMTTWATVVNKSHCQEEESIRDYLTKQREMFLVQYSLSVKRETIQKLQNIIVTENHRIHLAEKQLEEDAIAFERFLKENDQNSVDAVKQAEKETIIKLEKTTEIKKATAKMMTIKSEISKYQETLKEYETCKRFLMAVAPPQWHGELKQKRRQRYEAKMKGKMKHKELNLPFICSNIKATGKLDHRGGKAGQISRKSSISQEKPNISMAQEEINFDLSDSDEEPAMCFSDPKEMLDVLTELEEQNLSYIQNFQETEEAMDEIRKTVQLTQEKMDNEIQILQQQISIMKATIQREREKVSELKLKSKIFSYGEFKAEKQDAMLNQLHKKVKEVYKACIGELDSNITTLDMLANVENKVVEILDLLETMPPEKVDFVRSLRDKEKRRKLREERAQLKKQHQEERLKLAMERAISDSSKRTGRKLMPRSEPFGRIKEDKVHVLTTKEQQDYVYFFT